MDGSYVWHSPDWDQHRWWEGTGAVWRASDFNKTGKYVINYSRCPGAYVKPFVNSCVKPCALPFVDGSVKLCALPFVSNCVKPCALPLVNSDENVNNHARLRPRITRVCMVHPVQAMHAGVARSSVATTC
jgi:hypothetical protein